MGSTALQLALVHLVGSKAEGMARWSVGQREDLCKGCRQAFEFGAGWWEVG